MIPPRPEIHAGQTRSRSSVWCPVGDVLVAHRHIPFKCSRPTTNDRHARRDRCGAASKAELMPGAAACASRRVPLTLRGGVGGVLRQRPGAGRFEGGACMLSSVPSCLPVMSYVLPVHHQHATIGGRPARITLAGSPRTPIPTAPSGCLSGDGRERPLDCGASRRRVALLRDVAKFPLNQLLG